MMVSLQILYDTLTQRAGITFDFESQNLQYIKLSLNITGNQEDKEIALSKQKKKNKQEKKKMGISFLEQMF